MNESEDNELDDEIIEYIYKERQQDLKKNA